MPRNLSADFDISNENYVIFSSDEDDQTTIEFLKRFNVDFKKLHGKYNGEEETSFIVNKTQYPLCCMMTVNQESILELSRIQNNGMRAAGLRFRDQSYIPLGYLEHVTQKEALQAEAYTYDQSTETYFIAR